MSANQQPESNPRQSGNQQSGPGSASEQGFLPPQAGGAYGANPDPSAPGAAPYGTPGPAQYAAPYGAPGPAQYPAPGTGAPPLGPDGQPMQPGAYPPAGGFQPPLAEPPVKRNNLKRLLTSLVVIAISLIVVFVVRGFSEIKVDDCVKQVSTDRVEKVDCTSSEAKYKVLGIKEGVSQAGARLNACDAWPDATSIYWTGRTSASGTAYCLKGL